MSGQRITRDTFDAVVQEKMKRYRISMEQAIANTVREFQLEAGSSKMDSYDSFYREQERPSFRDLPRDSLDRKWDNDPRRESVSNPLYYRKLERGSSGGLLSDPLLGRWGSADPLLKERLYREELLARDLDLSRRNWELDRLSGPDLSNVRSDVYRDFRASQSLALGSVKEVYRGQGQGPIKPRGVMHVSEAKGRGQRGGGLSGKVGESSGKQQTHKDITAGENAFSEQIVTWAKFHKVKSDSDLLRQHKALFKVETEACRMFVNCFKGRLSVHHTQLCFSSLKRINHSALNSPKIDNDLLDLLVETKTVTVKNDFFEAIKPFDKEVMILQQRLLKCATPLLLACNTFELKHPFLTDPKQLLNTLDSTMFLARKSLVLLGQTFALATALRQNNVMEVLGIDGTELKPSNNPNFKDSFLFGKEFIAKLKDWLRKRGHKLTLRSAANIHKGTAFNKKEAKAEAESEERPPADPNVVATIDQLLEYAKKEDKGEGEKPPFWFLFDKNSSEYRYYQQKLEEFHDSTGHLNTKNVQTAKAKKSEDITAESVRAMLYARKALAVKRKLFGSFSAKGKRGRSMHRLGKTMKARKNIKKLCLILEKKNVTQEVKEENVTQETMEENVTQETMEENVTQETMEENVTQETMEENVTQETMEENVTQEAMEENVTQETMEENVTQEAMEENVTQDAMEENVTQEANVTPEDVKGTETPAAKKKEAAAPAAKKKEAAAPAAKKEAAAPAAKKEAAAPAAKKEAATPAATPAAKKGAATPAAKKGAAAPAAKKGAAAPAAKKEAAAPAAKKEAAAPAAKKEAAAPAAKKEAAAPAAKKGAAAPAAKKGAAAPAAKKGAATRAAGKANVTPEVKKENTGKPVQDASIKKSSKAAENKGQEVPDKNSTDATSKPLKKDQPSNLKTENSEAQFSDVDEKTKDTAIKLAQFVIQMGPEIEEFSMQNSANNPDFWFLREKDSPAYKYYKIKLEEFKNEQLDATSDVDDELESSKQDDEGGEMDAETSADNTSVAAFSQMPTPSRPPILRKRVAKLKVGMLPPKRVCLVDEPQVHDPVRIEYERPKGRGNNRRKKPADLEFAKNKLTEQNVGFQMLSKMGWREGEGLGSGGSGITKPVKVGSVSAGEGLGTEVKEPAQSKDDNFDAFRQRMMTMYKQKITK